MYNPILVTAYEEVVKMVMISFPLMFLCM